MQQLVDRCVALWAVLAGVAFIVSALASGYGEGVLCAELQWAGRYVYVVVFAVCLIGASVRSVRQLSEKRSKQ